LARTGKRRSGYKNVIVMLQRGKHKPFLLVLEFSALSTIPLASTSIHSPSSNKALLNSVTSMVLVLLLCVTEQ
jgi:hypothetical protein